MMAEPKKTIVIDANIAKSASPNEKDPRSSLCLTFLITIKEVCHRYTLSSELKQEWQDHRSKSTVKWQKQMENLRKRYVEKDLPLEKILISIQKLTGISESHRKSMIKDAHLLALALAHDGIIASCDDSARHLFAKYLCSDSKIADLVWVNPIEDGTLDWLRDLAPRDPTRNLGHFASNPQ